MNKDRIVKSSLSVAVYPDAKLDKSIILEDNKNKAGVYC
jgi:hypothetical protein